MPPSHLDCRSHKKKTLCASSSLFLIVFANLPAHTNHTLRWFLCTMQYLQSKCTMPIHLCHFFLFIFLSIVTNAIFGWNIQNMFIVYVVHHHYMRLLFLVVYHWPSDTMDWKDKINYGRLDTFCKFILPQDLEWAETLYLILSGSRNYDNTRSGKNLHSS